MEFVNAGTRLPGPVSGSHHHFILKPKSDRLVVFFSGTGKREGKFDFWKVGRGIDANVLFVNDDRNAWYQFGSKAFGTTLDDTVAALKSWCMALGIRQTTLVGASMGGYGAALVGSKLDVRVLAFGFDTVLRMPTSYSERLMSPDAEVLYPDLRPLLQDSSAKIHFYAGEMSTMDLVSAIHIADIPGVTIQTLRGAGHSVAKFLHERIDLTRLITAFIDRAPLPTLSEEGTICRSPALVGILHEAHLAWSQGDAVRCRDLCQSAIQLDESNEAINYLLALALLKLGDHHDASARLSLVVASLPDLEDAHFYLIKATRSQKQYKRALSLLGDHFSRWPDSCRAHFVMGQVLTSLGRHDEAVRSFETSIKDPARGHIYAVTLEKAKARARRGLVLRRLLKWISRTDTGKS